MKRINSRHLTDSIFNASPSLPGTSLGCTFPNHTHTLTETPKDKLQTGVNRSCLSTTTDDSQRGPRGEKSTKSVIEFVVQWRVRVSCCISARYHRNWMKSRYSCFPSLSLSLSLVSGMLTGFDGADSMRRLKATISSSVN